jgi:hypothetical protein
MTLPGTEEEENEKDGVSHVNSARRNQRWLLRLGRTVAGLERMGGSVGIQNIGQLSPGRRPGGRGGKPVSAQVIVSCAGWFREGTDQEAVTDDDVSSSTSIKPSASNDRIASRRCDPPRALGRTEPSPRSCASCRRSQHHRQASRGPSRRRAACPLAAAGRPAGPGRPRRRSAARTQLPSRRWEGAIRPATGRRHARRTPGDSGKPQAKMPPQSPLETETAFVVAGLEPRRVILTERSEVDGGSRRQPAVFDRAARCRRLGTISFFVAVVRPLKAWPA